MPMTGPTSGPFAGPTAGQADVPSNGQTNGGSQLGPDTTVGYDPPFDTSGVFDPTMYRDEADETPFTELRKSDGGRPDPDRTQFGPPEFTHTDLIAPRPESDPAQTELAQTVLAGAAPGMISQGDTALVQTRIGTPEEEAALQRGLRAVRQSAGGAADAADAVYGRIQRVTHAEGAGESGLANVIELHAVMSAGDLMITLALANSLFFSVQPTEAKTKVALYLVITMVPFTLLAPVIGPLLDRLRGGRRFAMALTALTRALLTLVLAKTISGGSLAVYPAAFGCLAASRAYGISRSAVIPRVLPSGSTLVRANGRISMAALAATTVATPIGLGLGKIGTPYTLGAASVLFFLATWLSIRLPKVVDSNEGELAAQLRTYEHGATVEVAHTMPDRRLRAVGPSVILALRTNAALRAYAGFVTLFFAFLVRTHPLDGLTGLAAVGVIAGALAIGNGLGSILGTWLKSRNPEAIVTAAISLCAMTAILTAFFYSLPMVLLLAGMAGLAPALSKLSLDALIQRDTLERVRTSAFAKSETFLQFAWVIGGGIALVLPSNGILGVSLLAGALSLTALLIGKMLSDLKWEKSPIPSRS